MLVGRKRGQATTFVILGLVILAVVILLFFLREQFIFGPVTTQKLEQQGLDPIRDHISECVDKVAPDYFERIGLQGGYLSTPPDTFKKINGIPVSYLCYNIEGENVCYNRYLTVGNMESQLANAIREGLSTCINLKSFARGADVDVGALKVSVDIGSYNSIVNVNMPVKITKGDVYVEEDTFGTELDLPLGALYDVARDIIEAETKIGEFDQLSYMLVHKGQFVIDKKRPYPDKMYILKTKDDEYLFQFFVQGEPSY
jgi:hypothetical protein